MYQVSGRSVLVIGLILSQVGDDKVSAVGPTVTM